MNDVAFTGVGHNLFVCLGSVVHFLIWLLLFLEQTLAMNVLRVPAWLRMRRRLNHKIMIRNNHDMKSAGKRVGVKVGGKTHASKISH